MSDRVICYQLAPEALSLMECYVIRTKDDKILVIDGGIDGYGLNNPVYLPAAIRAILGLRDGDYFEVEAWFLSHAHRDHYFELAKMLRDYDPEKSNYKINNIYFNFPDVSLFSKGDVCEEEFAILKAAMDNYAGESVKDVAENRYDALNGAVITPENIEKGLAFSYEGATLRVLQTRDKKGLCINSTSTILRLETENASVLFLNDAYVDTGDRLLASYGAEALVSDYVQLGHHGQHGPRNEFYDAIRAKDSVRLWPTPIWVWNYENPNRAIETDVTRRTLGLPYDWKEYTPDARDRITGLYGQFPADPQNPEDWKKCLDGMKIVL